MYTNEETLSPSDDEVDADSELPFRARTGELQPPHSQRLVFIPRNKQVGTACPKNRVD